MFNDDLWGGVIQYLLILSSGVIYTICFNMKTVKSTMSHAIF